MRKRALCAKISQDQLGRYSQLCTVSRAPMTRVFWSIFLNSRRHVIKMDLIGFYNANPAFFADIFAPTFLGGMSEGSLGLYLLTGLRGSCRAFARIVPRSRRDYLRHVCYRAIEEKNVEMCEHLLQKNPLYKPKFVATIMQLEITKKSCQSAWDDILCCIWPHKFYYMSVPAGCSERLIKIARENSIVSTICSSSMPSDRIWEQYGDLIRMCPYNALVGALTSSKDDIIPSLIEMCIKQDSSYFPIDLLLKYSGPRALEFYRMVRAYLPEKIYDPFVFEGVIKNAGSHAFILLQEILPHFLAHASEPQWRPGSYFLPCQYATQNCGPCALDMYRFWDDVGMPGPTISFISLQLPHPYR